MSKHDRRTRRSAPLLIAAVAAAWAALAWADEDPATGPIAYLADDGPFSNPQRGWVWSNLPSCSGSAPMSAIDFDALRARGITIIDQVYVIDAYLDAPLSPAFLAGLGSDFDRIRDEGFTLMPRFTYNWIAGCQGEEDAVLPRIEQHLQQLAPVLGAHQDVLALLQLSFIGRYGEMHSSSSGHVTPGTVLLSPTGIAVVASILDAVPVDRPWCLRYAKQKQQLHPDQPLTAESAWSGSAAARTGFADHGFAADATGLGSWDPDPEVREQEKAYVAAETRFVPQVGEPGGTVDAAYALDPGYVLGELERFHFAALVINQGDSVADGTYEAWDRLGIIDEAARRLGYRYRLIDASLPSRTAAGEISVRIRVANDGWSVPINRRGAELVLRHVASGRITAIPTNLDDLRRDFPAAGKVRTIDLVASLPAKIPAGLHAVGLRLPDPATTLAARPEYAIRLANLGIHDPATGVHDLGLQVTVVPNPGAVRTDAARRGSRD